MPTQSLAAKLQLQAGMRLLVLDAPPDILLALNPLPEGASLALNPASDQPYDAVLAFADTVATLTDLWPQARTHLRPGGLLWVAYPKLTGTIRSDITRDTGWAMATADDWHAVRQIALNDTWSALRFRPRAEIKTLTRKFQR